MKPQKGSTGTVPMKVIGGDTVHSNLIIIAGWRIHHEWIKIYVYIHHTCFLLEMSWKMFPAKPVFLFSPKPVEKLDGSTHGTQVSAGGIVDRRNPANQLGLVVYPMIYEVLYIPGGWEWDFWTIKSSLMSILYPKSPATTFQSCECPVSIPNWTQNWNIPFWELTYSHPKICLKMIVLFPFGKIC